METKETTHSQKLGELELRPVTCAANRRAFFLTFDMEIQLKKKRNLKKNAGVTTCCRPSATLINSWQFQHPYYNILKIDALLLAWSFGLFHKTSSQSSNYEIPGVNVKSMTITVEYWMNFLSLWRNIVTVKIETVVFPLLGRQNGEWGSQQPILQKQKHRCPNYHSASNSLALHNWNSHKHANITVAKIALYVSLITNAVFLKVTWWSRNLKNIHT